MSEQAIALEVRSLSKRFGPKVALEEVTFAVPAGSVFAVLGENGAGKTTLIRILLGLLRPDGGSAHVLGLDPLRAGLRLRRQVGYVPERPAFYGWMTVEELGWFAAGFHAPGYFRQFTHLLAQYRVPPDVRVDDLSRGQRALVTLCLALADEPPLLVLDEPTGGLDLSVRREFLESMVDVAATGRTVLLASHEIHEVERVADWVAILHQGRLVLVEPLRSLLARFRWLRLVLRDERIALPQLGATAVEVRRRGRAADVLLANWDEQVEAKAAQDEYVLTTSVRPATLEDIFLAALRGALSGTGRAAGFEAKPAALGPSSSRPANEPLQSSTEQDATPS